MNSTKHITSDSNMEEMSDIEKLRFFRDNLILIKVASNIEKMRFILDNLKKVEIEENIKESTSDDPEYPYYIEWPDENVRDKIESLCCELFIGTNGDPNMSNIQIFNDVLQSDYYVGPGEQDSFGWLTGVITTSDSSLLMLVFG